MRLRLPEERPSEPPTGFKIAHPMLSQDGGSAGFTGVSLGGALPYGVLADAACVYGLRHRVPHRRCDCGFHCVHERSVAEGLLCTAEHRAAVLLEVAVLGRYIRFERGFRYARQRVRAVTAGMCGRGCGGPAVAFADAGWGRVGWRALAPVCAECGRGRVVVSFGEFARLAGGGIRVASGAGAGALSSAGVGAASGAGAGGGAAFGVQELVAEAAFLQARLDWFQAQLARLGERGSGGSGQG
ncbi:hypothetical protein ACIHFC_27670 [Streptomyces sp. NPDC052013]|uniref:hypothetical protein n=1 Tax=Streptomyces sp. NPDC052013 TaxID=3365679 RepID=UPI0037D47A6A